MAHPAKLQNRRKPYRTTAVTSTDSSEFFSTPQPVVQPAASLAKIQTILNQVLSRTSPAMATILGTSSWFMDSACCNHMTSDSHCLANLTLSSSPPMIYTADVSPLHVKEIGTVMTSTLSIPDTYLVPKLSLNLLSMGQLCKLGLEVKFNSLGCDVQDPWTSQLLRTGHRIGRLFEFTSLQIPSSL